MKSIIELEKQIEKGNKTVKSIIELEKQIEKMRIAYAIEWCIENNIPNYREMSNDDFLSMYICLEIKERTKNEIKRNKEN